LLLSSEITLAQAPVGSVIEDEVDTEETFRAFSVEGSEAPDVDSKEASSFNEHRCSAPRRNDCRRGDALPHPHCS
jgi:hypothetical protein